MFWRMLLVLGFSEGVCEVVLLGIMPGWHGMENGQKLGIRKMESTAKNGLLEGVFHVFFNLLPFLPPVQLGAVFPRVFFLFFLISGFWLLSMPYQPSMIPSLAYVCSENGSQKKGGLRKVLGFKALLESSAP